MQSFTVIAQDEESLEWLVAKCAILDDGAFRMGEILGRFESRDGAVGLRDALYAETYPPLSEG